MNRRTPRIIVALDVDDPNEALKAVEELFPYTNYYKVGPQLFIAAGPTIIHRLQERGARIFLDLKLHDIPSVVLRSARAACKLAPYMFDVHALAGSRSIKMAVAAAHEATSPSRPLVLAVSLLVSHDTSYVRTQFNHSLDVISAVLRMAEMALACGADGIVCSAAEASAVRKQFGDALLIVCPGIRFPDGSRDDYPAERVLTIGDRQLDQADYLVMGRPILQSLTRVALLAEAQQILRTSQKGKN